MTCYDEAIKLDPKYAHAWYNKGISLNSLGRYEDALTCYDEAIKLDPKYAIAWNNKGNSLNSLGRYEEALTCYDEAIELDPKDAIAWNNKGIPLNSLGRYEEALTCLDKAIELDPEYAYPRFNRSETFFAMHRWAEGFESIRDAFTQSRLDVLGDTAAMFSLIFQISEDNARLQSRIGTLVDVYEDAAAEHGFHVPDQGAERRRSVGENGDSTTTQSKNAGTTLSSVRPAVNPLSYLGDGLVKSLAKIDAVRITPAVLESYLAAVEKRVADLPEFEIPLRLFRYGIRYLISGKESEFVELIQPERRIVRQALGLPEES